MDSKVALVDAVSTLMNSEYSVFAMFALVSYDWLINLDKEIQYFWDYRKGRKLTAAALLYGLSRYPAIIGEVLQLQTAFPMSDTTIACLPKYARSCRINSYLQAAANVLYAVVPAMFSSVRIYALSANNKAVAIFTFLLLFMPTFIITIINAMDKSAEQPSPFNCSDVETPVSLQVANRGICGIAGDMLVLFVTWHNTYTSYKAQRGVLRGPSLIQVMLYNGSFYFIVITAMNVLNMILTPIATPVGVSLGSIATIANNPVTAVLTCHFLFDLREAHRSAASPSSPSALPSLNFPGDSSEAGGHGALPAFIASMGSQLQSPGVRLVNADAIAGEEHGVYVLDGGENAREGGDPHSEREGSATDVSDTISVERRVCADFVTHDAWHSEDMMGKGDV
ncbi:hypothetical protein GSI_14804 [Ganoderma sinense ZZ0214-1]|uniref:DUF6533 domain-containing protein n=1 Tax=Ganoderma sinense ZZ0214-1 TaxID=1077348 RepID=A0A2G8RPR4_9APHY|nr:hypothetical protein GSI_14804 [Ganoderma sinense ZZ0214-1]